MCSLGEEAALAHVHEKADAVAWAADSAVDMVVAVLKCGHIRRMSTGSSLEAPA